MHLTFMGTGVLLTYTHRCTPIHIIKSKMNSQKKTRRTEGEYDRKCTAHRLESVIVKSIIMQNYNFKKGSSKTSESQTQSLT